MSEERKLVGHDNFVRHNPLSDKFDVKRFHHIEFYCSDATNTARRFSWGLGMHEVAKSDLSTAPFSNPDLEGSTPPHPAFNQAAAHKFVMDHGLAVRSVGIRVADAQEAHDVSVANGAVSVLPAHILVDRESGKSTTISEIKLFNDTVIRWISGDFEGPCLPNYQPVNTPDFTFGITRLDHCVSNVPKLFPAVDYLTAAIGFHEFSEFTAEDVGTVDSGLNSMVMASNNEFILMPINEPTFGTRRKSQIQTYLEHNNGAGVQHMALMTNDIFHTMREMKKRSFCGGFDFMPAPDHSYYERIPQRFGEGVLSAQQIADLEELGLLADKDDQGVLLQVFTKPLGDRPTAFIEIIQRLGCDVDEGGHKKEQSAGCGGFGKGNFSELFKSIEEFEKQQEEAVLAANAAIAQAK